MINTVKCSQVALRVAAVMFLSGTFLVARSIAQQEFRIRKTDALIRRLAEELNKANKKRVVVMDLRFIDGHWFPFGAWLADQFSSALAKAGQQLVIVDRARLKAAQDEQHLSPTDKFDIKTAMSLGEAVGADTLIFGDFGAVEDGIGVSLMLLGVSPGGIPQPNLFFGKVELTPDVASHLGASVDSFRPKDGIYQAGRGGVSFPTCIKCLGPSRVSAPDIDLTELLRGRYSGKFLFATFVVTPEGRTTQINLVEPLGYGLDVQYVNAVKDWEFEPALDPDDKPVPVHMIYPVSVITK